MAHKRPKADSLTGINAEKKRNLRSLIRDIFRIILPFDIIFLDFVKVLCVLPRQEPSRGGFIVVSDVFDVLDSKRPRPLHGVPYFLLVEAYQRASCPIHKDVGFSFVALADRFNVKRFDSVAAKQGVRHDCVEDEMRRHSGEGKCTISGWCSVTFWW